MNERMARPVCKWDFPVIRSVCVNVYSLMGAPIAKMDIRAPGSPNRRRHRVPKDIGNQQQTGRAFLPGDFRKAPGV
jgi:hypothetical protein